MSLERKMARCTAGSREGSRERRRPMEKARGPASAQPAWAASAPGAAEAPPADRLQFSREAFEFVGGRCGLGERKRLDPRIEFRRSAAALQPQMPHAAAERAGGGGRGGPRRA